MKARALSPLSIQRRYLILLVVIAVLYAIIVFLTPVDKAVLAKYKLTLAQVRLLDVFIILPLYVIWSLAFYGFSAFDTYARMIRRDRDGAAFKQIARGLMILAIGSAVATLIGAILGLFAYHHLAVVRFQVVIGNYLTMLITVTSFGFMYYGARRLCGLTRKRFHPSGTLYANLVYIGFTVLYVWLFLSRLPAARDVPLTATSHAAYYTPTWLLIPTFLVPYLLAWYLGGLTVYLLNFYTRRAGGSLYSKALKYLSYGLSLVIAGSIAIQVLTVFTGQLQNLSTAALLVIIYLLLSVIAAGYIPIAIGAKKLTKIETV